MFAKKYGIAVVSTNDQKRWEITIREVPRWERHTMIMMVMLMMILNAGYQVTKIEDVFTIASRVSKDFFVRVEYLATLFVHVCVNVRFGGCGRC